MIAILFIDGLLVASIKACLVVAVLGGFEPHDPTKLPRAIQRWWRKPR